MFGLNLVPGTVLCLGAHSDDIEIGCGATLLALTAANPSMVVHWVVFSANERRALEARAAAGRILASAGERHVVVESFRDGFFPWDAPAIKERFEALKTRIEPDLIFTHYREDRHQDHKTVSDLTWNTFRNHLILEYEVPKYDGDLGQPNCYMQLTRSQCEAKVDVLLECFSSQHDHAWFTRDTFTGLMRLRGVECAAPQGYAEAFHGRKITLGIGAAV